MDKGQIEAVSFRYKWELNQSSLEQCKSVGDSLESPVFTTTMIKELKWRLSLYPKGKKNYEDYMPLYLLSYDSVSYKSKSTLVYFSFTVIDKNEKEVIKTSHISMYEFGYGGDGYGNTTFLKKDLIIDTESGSLLNHNLTILCELTLDETLGDIEKKQSFLFHEGLAALEDLGELLESEQFSDVTFNLNNQLFHAHKSILSCRNPVFKAMFEHDMKEKVNNTVVIEDIEPEVFRKMLQFIYTAKVKNIKQIDAHSLLIAADKYSIEGLKSLCEEVIFNNLTINNAVKILKFADDYNATKLKKNVIYFIAFHSEKMVDLPEYQSIQELPARLVFEVLKEISKKKN